MLTLLWALARLVLRLRYRVRVTGRDQISGRTGVLFLPNHPAYIDPPIVLSQVWSRFQPRPLLEEDQFRLPVLRRVPALLQAIPLPDMERQDPSSTERVRAAVDEIVAGLNRGENHILWPAGRAQRRAEESLGSASGLAEILRRCPQASVVLVRTRGLWGSRFSYARTGSAPELGAVLLRCLGILAANLLLFTPRRQVSVKLASLDRAQLPDLEPASLNPFLERWYNEPGAEPPSDAPAFLLFRKPYAFPAPAPSADWNLNRVKSSTRKRVLEILSEVLSSGVPRELEAQSDLEHLGLDSLQRMELSVRIEQEFGNRSTRVPETVGALWAQAEGLMEAVPVRPPPPNWQRPSGDDGPSSVLGSTVGESFVLRARADRRLSAVADDLSGALDYERLWVGATLLARRIRKMPGRYVGILLPAAAATDLVFLAVTLADKVPVMLNWTTGSAGLRHAVRTLDLKAALTSQRFAEGVGVDLEGIPLVFLENLREDIGFVEKLSTLAACRLAPWFLTPKTESGKEQEPAVVLFTSGSERAPKAVPLTHHNILSNLRSLLGAVPFSRDEVALGFLPAFHSFGLTLTSLLPILSGFRLVHHPDPTDVSRLIQKIEAYGVTTLPGTPTFAAGILDSATAEELATLRLLVVGGESCPRALRVRQREVAPQAKLLEGYGVTECSPLVSCNRRDRNQADTIGLALPKVEVCVVHPETEEPCGTGEQGLLLVSGPNVFPGYLGEDVPNPFMHRDRKDWYNTGDLVTIDSEGFLSFRGRMKRFLKVGGEMISLPALEGPLTEAFPAVEEGPRVAVEGMEDPRCIVAFCTDPLTLEQANRLLKDAGFRGILRFDEVRQVPEIPLLGTGKTDYRTLRGWLQDGRS